MSNQFKRRTFLKHVGQTGALVTVGGSLQALLAACGGNVSNTQTGGGTPGAQTIEAKGLKTPGQLQWGGTTNGGAPYIFQNPDNPSEIIGYEVEIAIALASLMGLKQRLVDTDYPQLDQALTADSFDMIMDGWEITEDRAKTELFTDPYYRYGQQIVVRSDDTRFASRTTSDTMTLTDLEGLNVGTGAGFKAADILATNKKINLKIYDPDLPFNDLALKRIDAVFLDYPIVAYYVLGSGPGGKADSRLKPIGKPLEESDYVIAINKNKPDAEALKNSLNQAITAIKSNGTLRNILTKWKMWNEDQAQIGTK